MKKIIQLLIFILLIYSSAFAQEKKDSTVKKESRWEINLSGGTNNGKDAIYNDGFKIRFPLKYNADKTKLAYYSNLSFKKIFRFHVGLKLAIQSNRISYEHIYDPPYQPRYKTNTYYDLFAFFVSVGYNRDYKRFSIYSYLGVGTKYLLEKTEVNTLINGYSDHIHHSFNNNEDWRLAIPVAFSLGIDYSINRSFSISLNSGIDYDVTPFVLYQYRNYINYQYIYQSSVYLSLGVTYKIFKKK